jgi:hypothetical protein
VYEVMRRGGNNRVVASTSKSEKEEGWSSVWLTVCCRRYERWKFSKSFHCRHHHHTKECRHWRCQEWETLPCGSGGFRKGNLPINPFRNQGEIHT